MGTPWGVGGEPEDRSCVWLVSEFSIAEPGGGRGDIESAVSSEGAIGRLADGTGTVATSSLYPVVATGNT
jgi:hypothetical protein